MDSQEIYHLLSPSLLRPAHFHTMYYNMVGETRLIDDWQGGHFERNYLSLPNRLGKALLQSVEHAFRATFRDVGAIHNFDPKVLEVGAGSMPFFNSLPFSFKQNGYTAIDLGGSDEVVIPENVAYFHADMTKLAEYDFGISPNIILSVGSLDVLLPDQLAAFAANAYDLLPAGGKIIYLLDILPGSGFTIPPTPELLQDMQLTLEDMGLPTIQNPPSLRILDSRLTPKTRALGTCVNIAGNLLQLAFPLLPKHTSLDTEDFQTLFEYTGRVLLPRVFNTPLMRDSLLPSLEKRFKTSVDGSIPLYPSDYLGVLASTRDSGLQSSEGVDLLLGLSASLVTHALDSAYIAHHLLEAGFDITMSKYVRGRTIPIRTSKFSAEFLAGSPHAYLPEKRKKANATATIKAMVFEKPLD